MKKGLTRLLIHRFRGIREGQVEDLQQINLLIGPNNSGKTAILEMLYLSGVSGRKVEIVGESFEFKSAKGEKDQDQEKHDFTDNTQYEKQTNSKEQSTIFAPTVSLKRDFLHYAPLPRLRLRHEYEPSSLAGYRVTLGNGNLQFEIQRVSDRFPSKYFQIFPERPAYSLIDFDDEDEYLVGYFSLYQPERFPIKPPESLTKTKLKGNTRWTFIWDSLWVHRHGPFEKEQDEKGNTVLAEANFFGIWVEEGTLPDPNLVLFIDFHTATEPFVATFAQETWEKVPGWEERIAESIGRVFPELGGCRVSIRPGPQGKVWTGYVQEKGKYPVEIAQYGDGARHAFKVLATLIALSESVSETHPGLFLWEDSELFMHPATLSRLLREVLDITKDKPVQMFLSSQSIETTALLTSHVEELNLQAHYRVFRLDLQDGKLYVAKYRFENVISWLNAGMDLRFWDAVELPISYRYKASEEV